MAVAGNEIVVGLSSIDILLLTLIMVLGATLQASAGFGSGLVAVPLLGLVDIRFVPGPILFAYLFLCAFMAWRERSEIDFSTQKYLVTGLASGTFLSFFALLFLHDSTFPLIAALMVLGGVTLSLFHKEIHLNGKILYSGGLFSGIMSTLAGLSGPPMALLLQFQQPAFIRANLAFAFIFASLFSITALFFRQVFEKDAFLLGLLLVPGMFLGFLLGNSISGYLNQKASRIIILLLATISALSLLWKNIV